MSVILSNEQILRLDNANKIVSELLKKNPDWFKNLPSIDVNIKGLKK